MQPPARPLSSLGRPFGHLGLGTRYCRVQDKTDGGRGPVTPSAFIAQPGVRAPVSPGPLCDSRRLEGPSPCAVFQGSAAWRSKVWRRTLGEGPQSGFQAHTNGPGVSSALTSSTAPWPPPTTRSQPDCHSGNEEGWGGVPGGNIWETISPIPHLNLLPHFHCLFSVNS